MVPPVPSPPAPAAAVKPEGLADDFWDKDKGEVKYGDLTKRLNDLTAFQAEHASRAALMPATANDYEMALPEGYQAPADFKLDPDHPLLPELRAFAHEQGISKDGFKKLLTFEARRADLENKYVADLAAKGIEKLGPNGVARVDAVTAWTKARVGEEVAKQFLSQMYTPGQIEAWEKLMGQFRSAGMPGANAGGADGGKGLDPLDDAARKDMSFEEKWQRAELADPAKKAASGRR